MATKRGKKAAQTKTPVTDGFVEQMDGPMPPGAKPIVAPAAWKNGFGMAVGWRLDTISVLSCNLATPEDGGAPGDWAVKAMRMTADRQTVLEVLSLRVFKTNSEAWAFYKKEQAAVLAKDEARRVRQAKDAAGKQSANANGEAEARMMIMRKSYPDTFRALAIVSHAKPEDRPMAMESVFRAFLVDMVRLHKPKDYGEFCSKGTMDMGLIIELAKASNDASPVNERLAVLAFLASRWNTELAKLTKEKEKLASVVNAATGVKMTPGAMKRLRLRAGLTSSNPEGAPEKSSNGDK